jgi:hypothetical protein
MSLDLSLDLKQYKQYRRDIERHSGEQCKLQFTPTIVATIAEYAEWVWDGEWKRHDYPEDDHR